jgi:hypothetical protein
MRTSMTSARPAAAIPTANATSRATKKALRRLERQVGLAHAAGAGQREETRFGLQQPPRIAANSHSRPISGVGGVGRSVGCLSTARIGLLRG